MTKNLDSRKPACKKRGKIYFDTKKLKEWLKRFDIPTKEEVHIEK